VPGCGLAWLANFAVPHGPAWHENWPIVPCLGRRPGPQAGVARPVGHGVPSRPGIGPCRAGPGRCPPLARSGNEAKSRRCEKHHLGGERVA
jgi:hypothetical protein